MIDLRKLPLDVLPAKYCWLEVEGEPQSKKRVGFFRRRSYNPSFRAQVAIRWAIKAAYPRLKPDTFRDFSVRLIFFCGDYYAKNRKDGDNMEKLILDSMKGIVWRDDIQVRECFWRIYPSSGKPRTQILFFTMEG